MSFAEKPAQPPGESYASEFGYTIAGANGRSATGVSWEDLVKRELFERRCSSPTPDSVRESVQTLDPNREGTAPSWLESPRGGRRTHSIMGPAGSVHMTLGTSASTQPNTCVASLGRGQASRRRDYKRCISPRSRTMRAAVVKQQPTKSPTRCTGTTESNRCGTRWLCSSAKTGGRRHQTMRH